MRSIWVLLSVCLAAFAIQAARAEPVHLFMQLTYSEADNSPPPEDSLAVWRSSLNVTGLAGMPAEVSVHIPRTDGDLAVTIHLQRMVRREGFGERDPNACVHGDPHGCEIIPYPGFPPDKFSYSWMG